MYIHMYVHTYIHKVHTLPYTCEMQAHVSAFQFTRTRETVNRMIDLEKRVPNSSFVSRSQPAPLNAPARNLHMQLVPRNILAIRVSAEATFMQIVSMLIPWSISIIPFESEETINEQDFVIHLPEMRLDHRLNDRDAALPRCLRISLLPLLF